MIKKRYTQEDLKRCRQRYDKNFAKIMKVAGVNEIEHIRLIKIENKLYKQEVVIQKALGVYISNPCSISNVTHCCDCSGFYKFFYTKNKEKKCRQVKNTIKGAIACELKNPCKKGV